MKLDPPTKELHDREWIVVRLKENNTLVAIEPRDYNKQKHEKLEVVAHENKEVVSLDVSPEKARFEALKEKKWANLDSAEREEYKGLKDKFEL